MEKRTILFVYKGHFSYLPPFQALVEAALKKKVKRDLDSLQYDILWIIHERTAISMRDILVGRKYILTSYELRDYSEPELMKPLTRPMKEAKVNIQCEHNRAWIARILYGLSEP